MAKDLRIRTPLTRERVLAAAIRMADHSGIESLTMRKLAGELGVEAMSLYNHVANKEDLLAGIVDTVATEIELPSRTRDWKRAIRRSAISSRDVLLRHPWAGRLWMSAGGVGSARMRHSDWLLRTLREGGLSDDLVYHGYHVLQAYVLGYTFQQLSVPYEAQELAGMAERFLREFPVDEYPDLGEHIRQHIKPRRGKEGGFELGLDLILRGLEAA
jgi:AcrR family transcriptional regulator